MASETIANGTSEIIHRLDLNDYGLRNVPNADKLEAKREVSGYLKNEILRDVSNGVSPVQGEGRFRRLNSDYAVREKGGNRLSNLEEEGDLLNDFDVDISSGPFVNVGHTGGQTPKADGHNQLSGKAKSWANQSGFPKRRYIPDGNQKFVSKITREIRSIISEFVPARTPRQELDITPTISDANIGSTTEVTTDTLFSDDVIDSLLEDALRARGL